MLDRAVSEETLHARLLWVRTSLAFDIRLCDPPRRSDWLSFSDLAIERRSSRDPYGRRRAYFFEPTQTLFGARLLVTHIALFPPLLLSVLIGHFGRPQ